MRIVHVLLLSCAYYARSTCACAWAAGKVAGHLVGNGAEAATGAGLVTGGAVGIVAGRTLGDGAQAMAHEALMIPSQFKNRDSKKNKKLQKTDK